MQRLTGEEQASISLNSQHKHISIDLDLLSGKTVYQNGKALYLLRTRFTAPEKYHLTNPVDYRIDLGPSTVLNMVNRTIFESEF